MRASQWFAFIVALAGIAAATYAAIHGATWAAIAIAAISVGGPATATAISRLIPWPQPSQIKQDADPKKDK